MTRNEVDTYFQENIELINERIELASRTSITKNKTSVLSDIYILCIENRKSIKPNKIINYINNAAYLIYSKKNSNFNYKENRVFANGCHIDSIEFSNDREDQQHAELEERIQNLEYCLQRYHDEGSLSERTFLNFYVEKGVRTVRSVKSEIGLTHRGAVKAIKSFKTKIQRYEREAKIETIKSGEQIGIRFSS